MSNQTAVCSNCGEEYPIWDLEPIVCGRSKQYFCRDCLNKGRYRVDQRVIGRFQEKKRKQQREHK